MNPRLLLATFDSIYVLALAAWVGAILFFSFGVAPIIFRVLGAEAAARFVRALFPRYYAWGVGATAIALPALICGSLAYPELRGVRIGVQAFLIVIGLVIMLYCGNSLTPAINAARDAGPAEAARFDRLHKRSVQLNGVALLLGLILLVGFAIRAPGADQRSERDDPGRACRLRQRLFSGARRDPPRPDHRQAGRPSRFRPGSTRPPGRNWKGSSRLTASAPTGRARLDQPTPDAR